MSGNASSPRALSVEFFGLPAVGKSELARRLGERLARDGIAVTQPSYDLAHGLDRPTRAWRKLVLVAGAALREPRASWRALGAALASGPQPSVFERVRLVFNWLLVISLARRAREPETVALFDQGLFQALWSFALEGDLERAAALIPGLSGLAPLPDYLVVSRASSSTVEDRVRARPENDSRLDVTPALLRRGHTILQQLSERIERELPGDLPRLVLLTSETDADLEHNVALLAELLAQRLRTEGGVRRAPDPGVLSSE